MNQKEIIQNKEQTSDEEDGTQSGLRKDRL
jgi:hypothetical protein